MLIKVRFPLVPLSNCINKFHGATNHLELTGKYACDLGLSRGGDKNFGHEKLRHNLFSLVESLWMCNVEIIQRKMGV